MLPYLSFDVSASFKNTARALPKATIFRGSVLARPISNLCSCFWRTMSNSMVGGIRTW